MVSHHPAKFGDHGHCGSGDITFLVAEEENPRCFRFNPPSIAKLFVFHTNAIKTWFLHSRFLHFY